MRLRHLFSLFALACSVASSSALADESTELERGKNSYDAGRYEEGAQRFRAMLDPRTPTALKDPAAVERARAYYAACLIALGKQEEADQQMERVIRQNPLFVPDPVTFPGKVIDGFTDIKARFKVEIEGAMRAQAEVERMNRERIERARRDQEAYSANLQRLASQEVVRTAHSRWVALLPCGVGQFQNGQDALGWSFLGGELLLAGVSVGTALAWRSATAEERLQSDSSPLTYDDVARMNDDRRRLRRANLWSTLGLAALVVGGAIHAELSFVPDTRHVRPRPAPHPPSVTPNLGAPVSGGSWLMGLEGTF